MRHKRSPWYTHKPNTVKLKNTVDKSKRKCSFLDLPGEVRNQIYEYHFTNDFRAEIVARGTDLDPLGHKMTRLGFAQPHKTFALRGDKMVREVVPFRPQENVAVRYSGRLGGYNKADGLRTNWSSSLCPLILVSKLIHHESIFFLYQRTTFVFNAPKRINKFFSVVPAANLALVKKLELHYANYGYERFIGASGKDSKQAQLDAWTWSCKTIAKRLVNLQELNIWVYVTANPLWFDLRQKWLIPLWSFYRRNLASQGQVMTRNNQLLMYVTSLPKATVNVPKRSNARGKRAAVKKIPHGIPRINVYFDTCLSRPGAFEDPGLAAASVHLHKLFGNGIARALMGASEEEAMAEFMDAWHGRYWQWRFHLKFHWTGW